jgi:phosphotransacetylase
MANYDVLKSVTDLVEMSCKLPDTTVLVPDGDRVEDIRFVDSARDRGIIQRAIMIGNQDKIHKNARELGVAIDPKDIVDIGFESGERPQDILIRKIKRLTKVISIQEVKAAAGKFLESISTQQYEANNSRSIA